ncbi:acyl-CoA Delta-9 desaturase-like [Atheta coriaria]|uniref:acyl-CoA Delta-9 desaturase-like n=1 Tax=Dalotia coriaria TaxID=877792 RepID=UPI0031F363F9
MKQKLQKTVKVRYVWSNIMVLGILHLAGLYGMFLKFQNIPADIFMIVYGVISTLGITGGAHRLWHGRPIPGPRATKWPARTFEFARRKNQSWNFCMCIIFYHISTNYSYVHGTYQNSIYIWARDHRLHHKCSETDADPHNAKRGFFFSHVGWLMMKKHPDVINKGKTIDMSDL